MISVAVVEDREDLLASLAKLLSEHPGFRYAGGFRTAEKAIEQISALNPDVLLVDLRLPGVGGIECIRAVKRLLPKLEILVLTVEENPEKVFECLKVGARGYLVKRWSIEKLLAAVEEIWAGGAPMSPQIARMVLNYFSGEAANTDDPTTQLTNRERGVLDLVAQGFTDKEIGKHLYITDNTVNSHLRHIYEKLHVNNRTAAATLYNRSKRKA